MSRVYKGIVEILPVDGTGRFVGVRIPARFIAAELGVMRSILGAAAVLYESCRQERYGDGYHVTLVSSPEFRNISREQIEEVAGAEVLVSVLGLGRSSYIERDTFYAVCCSDEMSSLRKKIMPSLQQFHITLGFKGVDLHGVDKGPGTLIAGAAIDS